MKLRDWEGRNHPSGPPPFGAHARASPAQERFAFAKKSNLEWW